MVYYVYIASKSGVTQKVINKIHLLRSLGLDIKGLFFVNDKSQDFKVDSEFIEVIHYQNDLVKPYFNNRFLSFINVFLERKCTNDFIIKTLESRTFSTLIRRN